MIATHHVSLKNSTCHESHYPFANKLIFSETTPPEPIPPEPIPPEVVPPVEIPPVVIPPQVLPPERIPPERDISSKVKIGNADSFSTTC